MTTDLTLQYVDYLLSEKDLAFDSVERMSLHLRRFAEFMGGRRLKELEYGQVGRYVRWLQHTYGISEGTAYAHLITLKCFLRFAQKRGVKTMRPDIIDIPNTRKARLVFLYPEEVQRMVAAAKSERDKMIIYILFDSGMRVGELVNLRVQDIDFKRRQAAIRGKGSKDRIVFFTEGTLQRVKAEAIGDRVIDITARQVERIVTNAARDAGIEKTVSPHTLRHSFATDLLNNGADVRFIQEMLGHSSIQTTQAYTHVANPKLREVYEKAKPNALRDLM